MVSANQAFSGSWSPSQMDLQPKTALKDLEKCSRKTQPTLESPSLSVASLLSALSSSNTVSGERTKIDLLKFEDLEKELYILTNSAFSVVFQS